MDTNKDTYAFPDLIELMQRLRAPKGGCPWDIEQNFKTIKPHTIEEAFEVADAIERGDMNDLKDELGDLLFQVIFHAQMADEGGFFTINDIIDHVTKKMIFRHPHVFGDDSATTAKDVEDRVWQAQKDQERAKKGQTNSDSGHIDHYLDDVTRGLPSLLLANKIQKRVRKVGFEFATMDHTLEKLAEEIQELRNAHANGDEEHIQEELGDVLFAAALLATDVQKNPEDALRDACLKFIKRFNAVEDDLKDNDMDLKESNIDQMVAAWKKIKTSHDQVD